jgi:hypothetical protein
VRAQARDQREALRAYQSAGMLTRRPAPVSWTPGPPGWPGPGDTLGDHDALREYFSAALYASPRSFR